MVKVCHMTSVHKSDDNRIFNKECISLAKKGYEVYLVAQGDSFEKNGVKVIGVGDLPQNRVKRMTEGAKKVYETALRLDCEIYHFHDPELLPYGLKLKKAGKKVIFDSHELYREQLRNKPYLPKYVSNIIADFYTVYEKKTLKKIDAVIFPCPINGKNPFEDRCKNFAYINNLPKLEELYYQYDDNVEKYERSICCIGSISEIRGITNTVIAAGKSDSYLYLGGAFQEKDYEEKVKSLPEYKNTKYLGFLNRNQVTDILKHCQIGTSLLMDFGQYNKTDNLPTKVYEFMAMGLPVVMSKSAYNNRMVEKYGFGVTVNPTDVDEIVDAINMLLDNPETMKKMGDNGRKAVKEYFNWENEEKTLISLYSSITN